MKVERELDLREILLYLWHHIVTIVICILVGIIGGISVTLIVSLNDLPYEASALICFDLRDTLNEKNVDGIDQFDYYGNITALSNAVVTSKQVLGKVVDNLGLETDVVELADHISVSTVGSSSLMRLSVKDKESEMAQRICNEILIVMPDVSSSMTDLGVLQAVSQVEVSEVEGQGMLKALIMGGLLGFIFSVLVLIALELFDHNIHDAQDIEYYLSMKTLGVVPTESLKENENLSVEVYRSLCINLEGEKASSTPSVVLVTGICESDSSAQSAEKLAHAFAQMGKKVALVDLDLRNGNISKHFGLQNKDGISEFLMKMAPLETILLYEKTIGATVIPLGKAEQTSTGQLLSIKTEKLFKELRERFDVVVVHTGAVILTSEAVELSPSVDNVLLVVRVGKTPIESALLAKEKMEYVKAPVNGVVLADYDYKKARRRDGYYYAFSTNQI